MKKIAIIISLITVLSFSSCKKDRDFNGEREDLENFLGTELLEALDNVGYTIHYGDKPPKIEGKYLVSPLVLKSSTVPGDLPGKMFNDLIMTFRNQKNSDLTIDFEGDQPTQNSIGKGTYISGNGNFFTVVVKTEMTKINGGKAILVFIVSGKKTSAGIKDTEVAAFMVKILIEDNVVPFIPENTGRVTYDADYISTKI